jgi:recombinational DNA repair protein (RecF pathway)
MQHRCAFCNETIQQVDFDFGDVHVVDDEHWHADCYAEYFDEPMDEEMEVLEA